MISLAKYTSLGSYPIAYLTREGGVLCPVCAAEQIPVPDAFVNWEGPELFCEECNERIESAYAEPEDK